MYLEGIAVAAELAQFVQTGVQTPVQLVGPVRDRVVSAAGDHCWCETKGNREEGNIFD